MSEITKAEKYLVEQISQGNSQAWSQFVDRYRGRLLNFAQSKVGQRADAEDVVQEVFVGFIRGFGNFRQTSGLETYLFAILRRRIVDLYRSRGASHVSLIQDSGSGQEDSRSSDVFSHIAGTQQTASWYVRRDEQGDLMRQALADAILGLVKGYKQSLNFRDLQIVELIFYCQLPNTRIAQMMNVSPQNVGVIKHRCIKQIRENALASYPSLEADSVFESLLTEVWETHRPSCPKRSTIGGYLLETLESQWQSYVDFHLNEMGCHFCRANLDDLKKQNQENSQMMQNRIMQSTVGFLRKG